MMNVARREVENTILAMADIVLENRNLREEIERLRLSEGYYRAVMFGKTELAEKLHNRIRENDAHDLMRCTGCLSSDTKVFLDDMENLTIDDLKFLGRR